MSTSPETRRLEYIRDTTGLIEEQARAGREMVLGNSSERDAILHSPQVFRHDGGSSTPGEPKSRIFGAHSKRGLIDGLAMALRQGWPSTPNCGSVSLTDYLHSRNVVTAATRVTARTVAESA